MPDTTDTEYFSLEDLVQLVHRLQEINSPTQEITTASTNLQNHIAKTINNIITENA